MKDKSKFKLKHFINYIVIGAATIIFTILNFTGVLGLSEQFLLEKITIAIILAVSLGLVVGFLGELSLGHAGFMCIGAYIGGKISALLSSSSLGTGLPNLLISIIVGGIAAAIAGVAIGLPALRLKGDYLAIVTLAFGEIVKTLFLNSSDESFGGPIGLETPRYDRNHLFIIGFVLVLVMLAIIQNIIRSKHGRAITSIRDSEIAARATGINVTRYKLLVFALSAFFAGIAGVLYSFSNYRVQCTKFDYNYSIEILVMVVLGGMGSVNGSILSATLITFLQVQLASILTGDLAVLQNIFYALVLILIVIYNNAPALKGFRETHNLKTFFSKLFKKKKEDVDPSLVKDDEAKWNRIPTKINMDELLSMDVKVTESTMKPDKDKGGSS
ncbi:branched-chain amino acid ABC transporter permease [bacterium]|nr:branched-chain amino acid ABC transporter permease [bacterium]